MVKAKKKAVGRSQKHAPGSAAAAKKAWTIMVYMAAAKDLQTEQAALADIKEMETADTSAANVVVQIDREWPAFPQRFRIADKASRQIFPKTPAEREALESLSEMSTGQTDPLISFLNWVKNDPDSKADHYLLVLWGHTYGLGFGREHEDPLTILELKRALQVFARPGLDILGANTCAMSYVEAAFELRKSAKYLVASQISMPFAGWPYAQVLKTIADTPDITPRALGEAIVRDFVRAFEQDVSMTLVELGKADVLAQPVQRLAAALTRTIYNEEARDQVVGAFLDTAHGDVRPLIDLMDLCKNLEQVTDAEVKLAAADIRTVLAGRKFVLEHASDEDLEGLHGLGIFAPGITGAADLERLELSEKSYRELELVNQKVNSWADVAYTGLLKALAPRQQSVADFVNGTGAASREDRTGVVQLVISLDRAFVKLDRALLDTRKVLTDTLEEQGKMRMAPSVAVISRLGPPYLRLAGPLGTAAYAEIAELAQSKPVPKRTAGSGAVNPVTQSLENLESALAYAERTVRRVLTNSRLGLGDDPDVKTAVLGADDPDVKTAVLGADDPDVKTAVLGADDPDVKTAVLGFLPWLRVGDVARSGSSGGTMSLVAMFRQIAWALRLLEESVGKLENVVRASLLAGAKAAAEPDLQLRLGDQINQALREVKDMVTNAKQVTRGVVVDPAYGLGPGVQPALRGTGRRHLALAGGLSSKYLRLL